ncbi:aminoglycoside phosphotransferase family protein, partial [Streptomyces sp. NPDC002491]
MTQAPTPTADTVRRLVRALLQENGASGPGPEARPVTEGGAPTTWWVGA